MAESGIYNLAVTTSDHSTLGSIGSIGDFYSYPSFSPPTYYYYSNWSYSKDRYFYQLKCPRCKKFTFCELEVIVECKCGAKLRAVQQKSDYDIAVTE